MSRDPQTIQHEIEQTRDALASTFDKLADRASPKNVADRAKTTVVAKVQTPAGKAAVGVAAGLMVLLVIRRIRNR